MCYNRDICAMKQAHIAKLENRNKVLKEELIKAKELLVKVVKNTWNIDYFVVDEINEFLKEIKGNDTL